MWRMKDCHVTVSFRSSKLLNSAPVTTCLCMFSKQCVICDPRTINFSKNAKKMTPFFLKKPPNFFFPAQKFLRKSEKKNFDRMMEKLAKY